MERSSLLPKIHATQAKLQVDVVQVDALPHPTSGCFPESIVSGMLPCQHGLTFTFIVM
jgi:hypothetical protein